MGNGVPQTAGGNGLTGRRTGYRLLLAVALVVQLTVGLVVAGVGRAHMDAPSGMVAATGPPAAAAPAAPVADAAPADAPVPSPPVPAVPQPAAVLSGQAPPPLQPLVPLVVPEPGEPPTLETRSQAPGASAPATTFTTAAVSESEQIFAREYPAHAAARQRDDVASSFHWAVIVGVNDYMGRTSSTIGSVGDAHVLRDTLYRQGWRGDQVLTLTDHEATHDRIVRAIEWLIRSTDHRSTVVFSFSGHMRHDSGVTALWPADNRFIWAGDLSRMLGAVRADRMWASLKGCHAAGLAAAGMEGTGRVVTYASRVEEKAYEDPQVGHSVMGYYLLAEGLRDGLGDRHAGNGDGRVSVQEAFAWAAPRATALTTGQSHGPQRPVIVDGLGGREFPIAVTGAPPPASAPAPAPAPDSGDRRNPPRGGLIDLPNLRVPPRGILD